VWVNFIKATLYQYSVIRTQLISQGCAVAKFY